MYRRALGIVETVGLVGSVEAADAMTKCADVGLIGREEIGGGLFAVGVRGDVGAVRAALEAGVRAAKAAGEFRNVLLIPRPHDELEAILVDLGSGPGRRSRRPDPSDLDDMNVHQLRSLARDLPDFPMKGREISVAHRDALVSALRDALSD
ncbi:MAG: BMC domain-containing protein [Planctomycetota bacterium]